jgi:hypothetical protein
MDASFAAMKLADAVAMSAEAGQTVTINAVSYACMIEDATLSPSLELGGVMDRIDAMVKIPATPAALAAASYMAIGKKLTWDGRTYRIMSKSTKPGSGWVKLGCQDADQH